MSWENLLKNIADDIDFTTAERDDSGSLLPAVESAEYNRAKGFLEEDIANVIRELEELQEMMETGQSMDYGTNEMEELSDALGKVSVLLQ